MNLIIFIVLLQVKNVILFTGECTSNDWAITRNKKEFSQLGGVLYAKVLVF